MSTQNVICEKIGHCGVISLDRPKALNALSLDMVFAISAALRSYAADRDVASVVVRSTSPRAFCSGGDIKALYELGRAGKHAEQMELFRAEYNLCRQISRFPKPYVALVDAIAMGGGVGISVHGSHRIGG
ncbi:MAG TPA: enoyl-CoA hydratase/isomerase family protein, partial [Methylovirgula sp.]